MLKALEVFAKTLVAQPTEPKIVLTEFIGGDLKCCHTMLKYGNHNTHSTISIKQSSNFLQNKRN